MISVNDQSDALIAKLNSAGYRISMGNGWNARQLEDGEGDDGLFADVGDLEQGDPANYDQRIDGFWFTWSVDGMADAEFGETFSTATGAWTSAMEHFFDNASIPMRSVDTGSQSPALDESQLHTILAALRLLQQVDAECAGDLPGDILALATNDGKCDRLDTEEIDQLCEELAGV